MTDITIGASRKRLLEIADQLKEAFGAGSTGHTDTVVYAHHNSAAKGEVVLTFSNDDAEPGDGGYQGDEIIVDIDED